jgi:hypothetical protein
VFSGITASPLKIAVELFEAILRTDCSYVGTEPVPRYCRKPKGAFVFAMTEVSFEQFIVTTPGATKNN